MNQESNKLNMMITTDSEMLETWWDKCESDIVDLYFDLDHARSARRDAKSFGRKARKANASSSDREECPAMFDKLKNAANENNDKVQRLDSELQSKIQALVEIKETLGGSASADDQMLTQAQEAAEYPLPPPPSYNNALALGLFRQQSDKDESGSVDSFEDGARSLLHDGSLMMVARSMASSDAVKAELERIVNLSGSPKNQSTGAQHVPVQSESEESQSDPIALLTSWQTPPAAAREDLQRSEPALRVSPEGEALKAEGLSHSFHSSVSDFRGSRKQKQCCLKKSSAAA